MTTRNLPTAVRSFLSAADTYNVAMDVQTRMEIERTLTLIEKANAPVEGPSLPAAFAEALLSDVDPVEAPDVLRAIIRRELETPGARNQVEETARVHLHRKITENLDDLIAAFKPAYTSAAETFAKAHATLTAAHITGLDDDKLKTAPLPIARANLNARESLSHLRAIADATSGLLVACDRTPGARLGLRLRTADTGDATASHIEESLPKTPTPWEILDAGYTLSLATPTEIDERNTRALEAQERANADARRDRGQEARVAAMARSRR